MCRTFATPSRRRTAAIVLRADPVARRPCAYIDRILKGRRAQPTPDAISDIQAAALLLKGLTASSIVNRIFRPKAGDTILIHAAASGVGLLLIQWSKHLGATVIGTVGNTQKAGVAVTKQHQKSSSPRRG